MIDYPAISRIAQRQHGLVTTAQLFDLGVTHAEQRTLKKTRQLVRVRRNVHRAFGAAPTWEQALCAVILSVGSPIAISHASALALLGLGPRPRDGIHILVPMSRNIRLPGVICHRTVVWQPQEIVWRAGIPTTSAARTILDMSSTVALRPLGRIADEAERRGLLTVGELALVRAAITGGRGRSLSKVDQVVARRSEHEAPGDSPPEVDLAVEAVRRGFPRPTQLHRVRVGDRTLEIDLAWPDRRIGIDYDGFDPHRMRSAFDHDRRKGRMLRRVGWVFEQVTSETDLDELFDDLRRVWDARTAS